MKKIISVLLAVAIIATAAFSFTACTKNVDVENLEGDYTGLEGTTLNVMNWGEYISDGSEGSLDVIAAFEKVSGIKVNYDCSTPTNEAMYAKLKNGAVSVDVVIPSDYMIARLASEGLIQKFDTSELSNYHYIDEQYKNLYYDENNEYSVPYNVGLVGIIYDSTVVEGTPDSWAIMWDETYSGEILNFNNSRDAFMTAACLLGIDVNTTDKSEWDQVAAKMKEEKSVLQGFVMDEIFNKMEAGNAAIAPYYAGDFLTMKEVNDDLEFFYPKEGTNIFVDAMCIPTCATNVEAAKMFINFMLEPEVALANAEYICYASPNTAVLNNPDYSLKDNKYLYPDEDDMPVCYYYYDLDAETRSYMEQLWEEVVR